MFELKEVQQISEHGCAVACIAMITGKDVSYVNGLCLQYGFDVEKNKGMSEEADKLIFSLLNHITELVNQYQPLAPGLYIASVKSLNRPGGRHAVVIECFESDDQCHVVIYDPQRGRDGVEFYDYDAYQTIEIYRIHKVIPFEDIKK